MDWQYAESALRLGIFLGTFLLLALLECVFPKRKLLANKVQRWANHFLITVFNTLILRLLFPAAAVGAAWWAHDKHWGVLNQWALPLPASLIIGLTLILLDFLIWAQHLLFHKVPLLWRFHRLHHSDIDIDITTALRFHPIELIFSMLIKIAAIIALGVPPLAALIFEIALNATAMFNHSNLSLPATLDKTLRWFIVTPDMHRVHHSWYRNETDSNYGFNLPWWDKLFGTYRAQPADGHTHMTIGLEYFREPIDNRIDFLLTQPLRSPNSASNEKNLHDR